MLEPDSVMKKNSDYYFSVTQTDECELMSKTSDNKARSVENENTVNKNIIIFKNEYGSRTKQLKAPMMTTTKMYR